MKLLSAFVVVMGIAACDSNPTPHPAQDVFTGGNAEDTASPTASEPDDNDNGVGDCTEVQQFWDGEACRTDFEPSVDAGDASDGSAEVVDATVADDADGDDATAPDVDPEVTAD